MAGGAQHVAVVGGGIVGICTALALLEAGQRVTLIEKGAPGQATSFGNAGIISPWSVVPQAMPGIWRDIPAMLLRADGPAGVSLRHGPSYVPWLMRFLKESAAPRAQANSDAMHHLCGDAVSLYRQLLAGTGHEDLIADAMYVHAYRDAAGADVDTLGHRMRRAKGAELERINAGALRDLEPALSHEFQAAVLIKGQARARDPGKIGTVLAAKITGMGGQVLRMAVRGLRPHGGGWQVTGDGDAQHYDKVVLAAGIWSQELLKPLGITLPLAAERGYHVSYPDSDVGLSHSVMDVQAHAVGSSMSEGLRVAGVAEFAGVDTPPNPKRLRGLQRTAEAMIPHLKGLTPETWMGVRPSFPDSLPVIQEFAGHPGLIGAFGHSHYGLMMAPKTGRLVADIATRRHANVDLKAYGIERF